MSIITLLKFSFYIFHKTSPITIAVLMFAALWLSSITSNKKMSILLFLIAFLTISPYVIIGSYFLFMMILGSLLR